MLVASRYKIACKVLFGVQVIINFLVVALGVVDVQRSFPRFPQIDSVQLCPYFLNVTSSHALIPLVTHASFFVASQWWSSRQWDPAWLFEQKAMNPFFDVQWYFTLFTDPPGSG